MISINLLEGSSLEVEQNISGVKLSGIISNSLQKKAIAMFVDDVLCDINTKITKDCTIRVITVADEVGLDILRHDTAHVLAQAIKEVFPSASLAIGPTIKDGFYYDMDCDLQISTKDLEILEKKMVEIIERKLEISKKISTKSESLKYFKSINEHYKVEIINDLPDTAEISLYTQGSFVDLCKGPHSPNTSYIKKNAFKLTKISGAYWRGNSKNKQLQRIYGTVWNTKKELDAYLYKIEEATKRDHRKIGKSLSLFHIDEENPGMVFWHHKGFLIFKSLENYIRDEIAQNGYLEVKTPIVANSSLWEKSGHNKMFHDNMFSLNTNDQDREYTIKPMNCPLHIEIYKQKIHSYRDLPLRISEFGCCHRNESSGSLHGLLRVRSFTQDDAHVFCTTEQIEKETSNFCHLLFKIYKKLGFEKVKVLLSDRPEARLGDDNTWDIAENALTNALSNLNIDYCINKGEGAFYGPKIEFILVDSLGRDWQCGTLQLDFILPKNLGAKFIDKDNKHKTPVMIHRAILGTFERFIGILLEHYAGKLPFWLSPTQIAIIPIINNDKIMNFIDKYIINDLNFMNIRYVIFNENKTLDYKIRKSSEEKFNLIWTIGEKEVETDSINERTLGSKQTQNKSFKNALQDLKKLLNK